MRRVRERGVSSVVSVAFGCLMVRALVEEKGPDLGERAAKPRIAARPIVECREEAHLAFRHLLALPDAGRVLLRLRNRRIAVDGRQGLFHALAVTHARTKSCQLSSRVLPAQSTP